MLLCHACCGGLVLFFSFFFSAAANIRIVPYSYYYTRDACISVNDCICVPLQCIYSKYMFLAHSDGGARALPTTPLLGKYGRLSMFRNRRYHECTNVQFCRMRSIHEPTSVHEQPSSCCGVMQCACARACPELEQC